LYKKKIISCFLTLIESVKLSLKKGILKFDITRLFKLIHVT